MPLQLSPYRAHCKTSASVITPPWTLSPLCLTLRLWLPHPLPPAAQCCTCPEAASLYLFTASSQLSALSIAGSLLPLTVWPGHSILSSALKWTVVTPKAAALWFLLWLCWQSRQGPYGVTCQEVIELIVMPEPLSETSRSWSLCYHGDGERCLRPASRCGNDRLSHGATTIRSYPDGI